MARSRKPSDKTETSEPETPADDSVEDAVVVEDTAPPGDETEEAGASSVEATEEPTETAENDQAPVLKLEEDQEVLAEEARDEPETEAEETEEGDRPAEEPPSEPERPAPPPPPAPSGIGAGGVAALIFGGVVAALLGVLASRYIFPDGWPGQTAGTEAALAEIRGTAESLRATVEQQATDMAGLRADVESLRSEIGSMTFEESDPGVAALRDELGGQLDAVQGSLSDTADRIAALTGSLDQLSGRVEQLELRPMPEGLDTSSLESEIANFRAELSAAVDEARQQVAEAQQQAASIAAQAADEAARREAEATAAAAAREAEAAAEAERLRAEAEAAAQAATARAAVARVVAAVENGEPFAEDLAGLPGDVPDALSANADTGVPTLGALQESFPAAARAALDASIRANVGDSAMDRFTAFLRVQSGARSLEPREGDDPDAILSRAEAALRTGDIGGALAEIEALPEAGRAEMSGWTADARARLGAQEAAAALADGLNQN